VAESVLRIATGDGEAASEPIAAPDHAAAVPAALDRAEQVCRFVVGGIGYRIVHGGATHTRPEAITPALLSDLRGLCPLDPVHMPRALMTIDAVRARYPGVPHVACFDTAFHQSLPEVARRYPLPRWTADAGVRRYGFHGLSCEFVAAELARLGAAGATERAIVAHLGSGASVTAMIDGRSVETTMGFSPTGGLMMATRSGDLDPTVLTFLAREAGLDAAALDRLVNDEAGLLGVSGLSGDVRDLLQAPADSAAAEAVELFCYLARKHIGSLAAVLDGVDVLVFTGGIGEHAAPVRQRICDGLGYLGVRIDAGRNAANRDVISTDESRVAVRVIATDEEVVIARHVRAQLA
jgi:acetate kinase